jgi:hypothetical protein
MKGTECPRSLTEQVIEDAKNWWGGENPRIVQYVDKPDCFE